MKRAPGLTAVAFALALSGCTAPGTEIAPAEAQPAAAAWTFAGAAAAVRAASCAEGSAPTRGLQPLEMSAEPLEQQQREAISGRLPQSAKLAGAWELTSPDPNFGGLSGLAIEDDTTLLAVTDAGGWIRLSLAQEAPSAAMIGYMRGAGGEFLSGKGENDAEGLAVRDGIAFVSFERDFRIEAFAIGVCGAAAKAVEIAALPDAFDGSPIDGNEGPEALLLTPGGELTFGFEAAVDQTSPLGRVLASGEGEWSGARASNPSGFALVAMDSVLQADGTQRDVFLYRAFDPVRGARSVLTWGPGDSGRVTLSRPLVTDNFEGLAADVLDNGQVRLWIVSDNNFSKLQRTLIYAIDVSP